MSGKIKFILPNIYFTNLYSTKSPLREAIMSLLAITFSTIYIFLQKDYWMQKWWTFSSAIRCRWSPSPWWGFPFKVAWESRGAWGGADWNSTFCWAPCQVDIKSTLSTLWSTSSSSSPSLSSSLIGTSPGYHMILSLVGNCFLLRSCSKGSRSVKHIKKIIAIFSQVTSALCSSCLWWGCQESSLTRRRRWRRRWTPRWWPRWWARPEILTPVLTNHVY